MRSSILGEGRIAKEVQNYFVKFVEDEIIETDQSASMLRHHLMFGKAHIRLNLAWL